MRHSTSMSYLTYNYQMLLFCIVTYSTKESCTRLGLCNALLWFVSSLFTHIFKGDFPDIAWLSQCQWSYPWTMWVITWIWKKPGAPLLALVQAWIGSHTPSKVWDEITYPFLNVYSSIFEAWELISNFIPHLIMDLNTIHADISVNALL